MVDEQEKAEDGMSQHGLCMLIEGQIAQTYDALRMQKAWESILDGSTSPKVIARALVQVLSYGRYERRRAQTMAPVINVYVSGAVDPERIGFEIAGGIKSARMG